MTVVEAVTETPDRARWLHIARFWRNVRTHTLCVPVAPRLQEVGDYFLHGEHPPFALPF